MAEIINEGWELRYLTISKNWDNHAPQKYNGSITFANAKKAEMKFSIPPEKMEQMLELIADCVVASARELGQGLVQSVRPLELRAPEEKVLE